MHSENREENFKCLKESKKYDSGKGVSDCDDG